jgi:pimeloyl-ACP methyl ester carboxylesterase
MKVIIMGTMLFGSFLLLVGVLPLWAAQDSGRRWTPMEMDSRPADTQGLTLKLRLLPEDRKFPPEFRCDDKSSPCDFDLAYFLSAGFDVKRKQRLNILFIPGGPGAIVDPSNRSAVLRDLERRHNVVYFHPRGMGRSAVDGAQKYDQFLRADYVADDIEKLRQHVLKTRPWDAIYAHSWGTVVAQRYAARFGAPKDAEPKVKSLILSGPVDRHRADTHGARSRMTVDNLRRIFAYYRSQGAENCRCESSLYLRPLVTDFSDPQISTFGSRLGSSDNFCFLTQELADNILQQLEKMIVEIDENYGSAAFVIDRFEALRKDAAFQKRFARFPVEFFAAVRYLQMAGAPEKGGLVFFADSRSRVNAALLIAHTLTAKDPGRCEPKGALFAGTAVDCEYCERFKEAMEELSGQLGGRDSRRGNYVYGVYDGVARWIAVMMKEKACFAGKDLQSFAESKSAEKQFGRDQAKRIGIVAGEKICPWNPADFRHETPTLLIKGSRDTVVAGCQAEDFLFQGLKEGRRVLLEFSGMGHDLSVGNLYEGSDPSIWSRRYASLLEDFIKMSGNVGKFRGDDGVKGKIKTLRADDRTTDPKIGVECGKTS